MTPAAAVVAKGLLNIKKDTRSRVSTHPSWRRLAQTVSYDQVGLGGEVGYEDRGQGELAGIAEFGSARHAPHPALIPAAKDEAPAVREGAAGRGREGRGGPAVSAEHVAAIVARLAGDSSAPLRVYDATPASPAYPYVVVYADAGIGSSDREGDHRVRRTIGWQTTVVGSTSAQCRAALDRAAGRLEDWVPVVAGWSCSKVEHESSQPVRADDSLPDRVVFIATDQWSTVADPA